MRCSCGWVDQSIHGTERAALQSANRHVNHAANPQAGALKAILITLVIIVVAAWAGISYLVSPHAWKMPHVVGLTVGTAENHLGSISYELIWAPGASGTTGVSGASGTSASGTSPDVLVNGDWTVCNQSPRAGVKTGSAKLYLAHTGYGEKCLANGHATDPNN